MQKHVILNFDSNLQPNLDIFTGDLPYVISYNKEEGFEFYLKLYMMFYMLPQEINSYIKLGKNIEIGYIDEYSSIAPVYQLYVGRDWDNDCFVGLTSKIKNLNIGIKYYFKGPLEGYWGIHNKNLNFSMDYKNGLNFNLDYRLKDFYTLNFSYLNKKFYLGFGISWFNRSYFDIPKENCKYLAHRGELTKYPENSKIAFVNTIKDKQYMGAELDANETKDGKYAVTHDPFMFRFTGDINAISSYNMQDLEKTNISNYFHYKTPIHISELKDVAKIFKGSNKVIEIEVKLCGSTEKDVKRFLNYVDKYFPKNETVWFSSLDPYWVKEIKKLNRRKNSKVLYIYPFLMTSQSDYFYPSIYSEFKSIIKNVNPDGIIWFKPKADLFYRIQKLSKEYGVDMLYWDFADEIYYYDYSKFKTEK